MASHFFEFGVRWNTTCLLPAFWGLMPTEMHYRWRIVCICILDQYVNDGGHERGSLRFPANGSKQNNGSCLHNYVSLVPLRWLGQPSMNCTPPPRGSPALRCEGAVTSYLNDCSWVHFVCHGEPHDEPLHNPSTNRRPVANSRMCLSGCLSPCLKRH